MIDVTSYDSFEEMQEALAAADAAAFAAITPTQASLGRGSCWMRPYPEMETVIFGRCWTEEEHRESWAKYEADAEPGDPSLEEELQHYSQQIERGYLFGTAWSELEPAGELGSTHKSVAWPITAEQLEEARAADWDWRALPFVREGVLAQIAEVAREG